MRSNHPDKHERGAASKHHRGATLNTEYDLPHLTTSVLGCQSREPSLRRRRANPVLDPAVKRKSRAEENLLYLNVAGQVVSWPRYTKVKEL